jgi:hypothetical protein
VSRPPENAMPTFSPDGTLWRIVTMWWLIISMADATDR